MPKRHRWSHLSPDFKNDHGDTSGEIATGVNDISGKLPPISITPVENYRRCQQRKWSTNPIATDCLHLKLHTL
jgi:hypothetical protein